MKKDDARVNALAEETAKLRAEVETLRVEIDRVENVSDGRLVLAETYKKESDRYKAALAMAVEALGDAEFSIGAFMQEKYKNQAVVPVNPNLRSVKEAIIKAEATLNPKS